MAKLAKLNPTTFIRPANFSPAQQGASGGPLEDGSSSGSHPDGKGWKEASGRNTVKWHIYIQKTTSGNQAVFEQLSAFTQEQLDLSDWHLLSAH